MAGRTGIPPTTDEGCCGARKGRLFPRTRHRRGPLGAAAVCFALAGCLCAAWALAEDTRGTIRLRDVEAKARKLAEEPYRSPPSVPRFLSELDYDAWRNIRFDPAKALWKKEGLPFTVQFFHPGFYYDQYVKIHVVGDGWVREVPFSVEFFDTGGNDLKAQIPPDMGFAGFRLHYPINRPDYQDEVAVFLGASYLRSLAKGQQYGMSARGLAIDTALGSGEEFPRYTEFWIFRPLASDKQITVLALLDSPSVTGAYMYTIRPGAPTAIRVKSRLYPRRKVEKLGIAPLTSMFLHGENSGLKHADDFRPEVHDSDGLLVAFRSGEWLWRPLTNPTALRAYSFDAPDPLGFGLFQRDQNFDHYQDLEARYDARPSVWVVPDGKWGPGHVELIQIPTDKELNDNIIAFWVPAETPGPGGTVSFDYTQYWCAGDAAPWPPGGRVVATRIGAGNFERSKKFVVDFAGPTLEALPADKPLTAVVSLEDRRGLLEQQLYKNRVTGGWRLVLQILLDKQGSLDALLPNRNEIVELRAFLKDDRNAFTETWSYAYEP